MATKLEINFDTARPLETFDIKNIFLATFERKIFGGIIVTQDFDIFYKTDEGYTRYTDEGPELFKGDNSDGKGKVRNIVPVTDFIKKEDLIEVDYINGEHLIATTAQDFLNEYNEKYNIQNKNSSN